MDQARLVGVEHVICSDAFTTIAATLRRSLTEESLLLRRLREWLPHLHSNLRGDRLLYAISLATGEDPTRSPATPGRAKLSPRSLQRIFARDGLPTPQRWNQLGTALKSALDIQRANNKSLLAIACRRGRHDASSLSKLMNTCFGLNPGALRNTLGWKWLVLRWLRRFGRSTG